LIVTGGPSFSIRESGGLWKTHTHSSTGDTTLCVSNDYVVSWSCGPRIIEYFRTASDSDALELALCTFEPPDAIQVAGRMDVPGAVTIGRVADFGISSPWTFGISVEPGRHDVVATSYQAAAPDLARFVLRRNVSLTTAQMLPDLVMGIEGAAMVPRIVMMQGLLVGDEIDVETRLRSCLS